MVDINARTEDGRTALMLAIQNLPHTTEAVHALLQLKADVNIAECSAGSALHYAVAVEITDPTVTRCVITDL